MVPSHHAVCPALGGPGLRGTWGPRARGEGWGSSLPHTHRYPPHRRQALGRSLLGAVREARVLSPEAGCCSRRHPTYPPGGPRPVKWVGCGGDPHRGVTERSRGSVWAGAYRWEPLFTCQRAGFPFSCCSSALWGCRPRLVPGRQSGCTASPPAPPLPLPRAQESACPIPRLSRDKEGPGHDPAASYLPTTSQPTPDTWDYIVKCSQGRLVRSEFQV